MQECINNDDIRYSGNNAEFENCLCLNNICIIIIPTRRWVGHSGLNPKKSAIFCLKGSRTFCHIFLVLEHWVGPLSLNCTLHVVIKMHYTAAAHAQFMCYFVQKKYYPEGYN